MNYSSPQNQKHILMARRAQFNFNLTATINNVAVTLTDPSFTNQARGVYKPSVTINNASATGLGNWHSSIIADVIMGACCVIDPSTCTIDKNPLENQITHAEVKIILSNSQLGTISAKDITLDISYATAMPAISIRNSTPVEFKFNPLGADVTDLSQLTGQSELFASLSFVSDPVKGNSINVAGTFHHSVDSLPNQSPVADVVFTIQTLQFTNVLYQNNAPQPTFLRPLIRLATQVGQIKKSGTNDIYNFDLNSYLIPETSNPFPSLAPNYLVNSISNTYSTNAFMCFLNVVAATWKTFWYYIKRCMEKKSDPNSKSTAPTK